MGFAAFLYAPIICNGFILHLVLASFLQASKNHPGGVLALSPRAIPVGFLARGENKMQIRFQLALLLVEHPLGTLCGLHLGWTAHSAPSLRVPLLARLWVWAAPGARCSLGGGPVLWSRAGPWEGLSSASGSLGQKRISPLGAGGH